MRHLSALDTYRPTGFSIGHSISKVAIACYLIAEARLHRDRPHAGAAWPPNDQTLALAAAAQRLLQACLQGQQPEALQALQDVRAELPDASAAVNAPGDGGWTPLLAAAQHGAVPLVQALVHQNLSEKTDADTHTLSASCNDPNFQPSSQKIDHGVPCRSRLGRMQPLAAPAAATPPCTVSARLGTSSSETLQVSS